MPYDKNNIFAKILRKQIPCKKVFENEFVIPKGEFIDLDHFHQKASDKEIIEFNKAILEVVKILKISSKNNGYRVLSNIGNDGGQEVPHLHYHIFGGEHLGEMVVK